MGNIHILASIFDLKVHKIKTQSNISTSTIWKCFDPHQTHIGWQYDLRSITWMNSEWGCVWPKLLNGRWKGDGGEGRGELDVGADRDGADAEHAGVLRQLIVRLVQRQAGLDQRLEAVDKEFYILSIAVRLCEESSKPPEATEATALKEVKLLLTCVLATDHVLNDRLNSC